MKTSIIPFYPSENKYLSRSDDCYLFDEDWKKYVDFESGVWCSNLGHNYKSINDCIETQIHRSIHHGYRFYCRETEKLSEKLLQLTGFENGASVFLSSGSEAVNLAITLARFFTDRKKILKIDNSYLSAYGYGQISNDNHSAVTIKFNEIDAIELIDFGEISAFVLETGGASVDMVRIPDHDFIEKICKQAKQAGCLIVANEVTTGMGRMGKWFGYQYYDVVPDIIAAGKGLGNGYPISAVMINHILLEEFCKNPFRYAQSHQNDPLGCVVGLKVIETIENMNLIEASFQSGKYFLNRLNEIWNQFPDKVKDVRGRGLMLAMEFTEPFNGESLNKILFENGFVCGFKQNTLRFLPPLTIPTKEIDNLALFIANELKR